MMNILQLIGLSGVAKNENKKALLFEKVFQLAIGFIAIWLLIQWYLQEVHLISDTLIIIGNWLVWLFLTLELLTVVLLVKNKRQYLIRNWLGIVVVILCFPPLWFHSSIIITVRIIRFFVLLRVILPTYKTIGEILSFNYLGLLLLIALVITIFGGLLISAVDPHIHTPWDGIWWAWETITTVGYGDVAPSNFAGRSVAIFVMLLGSALFSIITANLAAYFISKSKASKAITTVKREEAELLVTIREMQKQLTEISKKIDQRIG